MSVQSCLTLWDLIVALQAPLSMGLSHQEYWSGLPFLPPDPFNLCSKPMRCMLIFSGDLFAIQRSQMIPNIINPGKGQFVLSPMIKSLYLRAPVSWLCECLCMHAHTQSLSPVQLFAAPWTIACQVLVYGIFQARILEWITISYSSGSSWPRDLSHVSCISCIGRWILYYCTTWETQYLG